MSTNGGWHGCGMRAFLVTVIRFVRARAAMEALGMVERWAVRGAIESEDSDDVTLSSESLSSCARGRGGCGSVGLNCWFKCSDTR